jgi:serine/threonine-protein kinase
VIADRLSSALSDRYRVERELGQGGMATVYLAEDLKHGRKVAIKVLHPELSAVIGGDRFLAEIKVTAALQHPHILGLIDSGEADGLLYYVMPYVSGESLRTRLTREKQLPIDDALRLSKEVASALDYAHRQGVVHRDIKPENILLQEGSALVADFGIALAVQQAGGSRMTQTGMSLGTPAYMSPEQAMGERDIGARSDVYALGAMTYEMLAGEPPFTGPNSQAIVAKVLTETPPPLRPKRPSVPSAVERAVLIALQKLPADRFGTAKDFSDALDGSGKSPSYAATVITPGTRPSHPSRLSRPVLLAAIALASTAAVAAGWLLRGTPRAPTSRQRVVLWHHPLGQFLSPGIERHATQAAIAPDGSSIVFTDSISGAIRLLRKLRNEREPAPLAGTEGAVSPFFSPDGAWIGYITTDGKLRKVPAGGGGSITLAEDANPVYTAAAWLDDGTIIFVSDHLGLRRISADGGASSVVLSDSSSHRRSIPTVWPLPGSRGLLYTTCPGNCAIESAVYVFDFAADSGRVLVENAVGAWYAPTGHLLYTDRAGGLYAAGFDANRLQLTTGPAPVIDGVAPASFTLSASGSVLYSVGVGRQTLSELVWVSRDGSAEPVDSSWRGEFEYPALSPDGTALAVSVRDGSTQLWIRRADGTRQKLTQEGTVSWRPSWSPDGRSVAYVSNMRGGGSQDDFDVYRMRVDGSAPAELLLRHTFGLWEAEFSRDGQWLVVRSDEAGNDANIRGRRLSGDTTLVPLVVDKSVSTQVALSPDGRWLAYVSNATGRREVYVAPFPDMTSNRLVSRDGGVEPRWAHSGRELFYKSGSQFMAVEVMPGPTFTSGAPRPLFPLAGYRGARNRQQYDISPDGRRFVMIKELGDDSRGNAVYVENWFAELKAQLKK